MHALEGLMGRGIGSAGSAPSMLAQVAQGSLQPSFTAPARAEGRCSLRPAQEDLTAALHRAAAR